MFAKVLFPVNQSRPVMDTAKKVIELALNHGSRIILMFVGQAECAEMSKAEFVDELLQRTRKQFDDVDIECDVVKREGKPAFAICDLADELNVDLIVIGTRGISLEQDIESTASRIVQLAPCPVLVVP